MAAQPERPLAAAGARDGPWPGLRGSLRGKRPVWLINRLVARGARKSTVRVTAKLIEINKNEEGVAGVGIGECS